MKIFVMDDQGKMRHMYRIPEIYSIWALIRLDEMQRALKGAVGAEDLESDQIER